MRAHCARSARFVRGLRPSGLGRPDPICLAANCRATRGAQRVATLRLARRGFAPQKYRPAGAGLWSGESAQARRTPERGAPFGFRPDQYFRLPPPPRPLARRGCGLDALAPRISLRDIRGSRWAIRRGPSCRGRSIWATPRLGAPNVQAPAYLQVQAGLRDPCPHIEKNPSLDSMGRHSAEAYLIHRRDDANSWVTAHDPSSIP